MNRPNGTRPGPLDRMGPESAASRNAGDQPAEGVPGRIDRDFVAGDVEWTAYVSGRGAYGTGHCGLAAVEAVHFAQADAPHVPLFEALLPAGRFPSLHPSELLELLRTARRIVVPEGGGTPAPRRFSLEEDLS
ncbi:MAG: hypothetical protein ACREMA_06595 [Longimicrobiales bacterium]